MVSPTTSFLGLALLFLLVHLPANCQVKSSCPWLNAATALGFLGGSVSSPTASISPATATACNFTYRTGKALRALRITVVEVKSPNETASASKMRCGSRATPLRGIGNEAVLCSADRKVVPHAEQVIGRVRNDVFTVIVSTSMTDDPSMGREALEEKAKSVAEQVAGNLF